MRTERFTHARKKRMSKQAVTYVERKAQERAKLIAAITLELSHRTPEWIHTARLSTLHRLYRVLNIYGVIPGSEYYAEQTVEYMRVAEHTRSRLSKGYSSKLDK